MTSARRIVWFSPVRILCTYAGMRRQDNKRLIAINSGRLCSPMDVYGSALSKAATKLNRQMKTDSTWCVTLDEWRRRQVTTETGSTIHHALVNRCRRSSSSSMSCTSLFRIFNINCPSAAAFDGTQTWRWLQMIRKYRTNYQCSSECGR